MNVMERIFRPITGLVLLVSGAGIIYAFHALQRQRENDLWNVGFFLLVEAYSIVGSLFILLGLRYLLGGHWFIEQTIARSLKHFVVIVILLSIVVAAVMVFAMT
jgi:uncharacterized membrane protein SirB2